MTPRSRLWASRAVRNRCRNVPRPGRRGVSRSVRRESDCSQVVLRPGQCPCPSGTACRVDAGPDTRAAPRRHGALGLPAPSRHLPGLAQPPTLVHLDSWLVSWPWHCRPRMAAIVPTCPSRPQPQPTQGHHRAVIHRADLRLQRRLTIEAPTEGEQNLKIGGSTSLVRCSGRAAGHLLDMAQCGLEEAVGQ